jgi:hypothetical protein
LNTDFIFSSIFSLNEFANYDDFNQRKKEKEKELNENNKNTVTYRTINGRDRKQEKLTQK